MSPLIRIDELLQATIRRRAGDLYLAVGRPARVRRVGPMEPLETRVLEARDTAAIADALTPEGRRAEVRVRGTAVFVVDFRAARFRVGVYRKRGDWGLVLRRIPVR